MKNPFAKNRIDYIINLADPKKHDKILNVGISNIPEIEMIIENKSAECFTIDIDKIKLDKAAKFLTKTKLMVEDINDPKKLKKGYYNKIIILEVLEHLKDDFNAMEKINSLLKIGGRVILSVPNKDFLHHFNPVKYTQHERHYSKKSIYELVESSGFKIEHFNIVESWRLLANLYVHLIAKYILRKNIKFGTFTKKRDKTYGRYNRKGLDFVISAKKVKNIKHT